MVAHAPMRSPDFSSVDSCPILGVSALRDCAGTSQEQNEAIDKRRPISRLPTRADFLHEHAPGAEDPDIEAMQSVFLALS